MPSIINRIRTLETRRHAASRAGRPIALIGRDPTDEQVDAFLAPYGVHPDDEGLIVIVRAVVSPDGKPTEPIPLQFIGGHPPQWLDVKA